MAQWYLLFNITNAPGAKSSWKDYNNHWEDYNNHWSRKSLALVTEQIADTKQFQMALTEIGPFWLWLRHNKEVVSAERQLLHLQMLVQNPSCLLNVPNPSLRRLSHKSKSRAVKLRARCSVQMSWTGSRGVANTVMERVCSQLRPRTVSYTDRSDKRRGVLKDLWSKYANCLQIKISPLNSGIKINVNSVAITAKVLYPLQTKNMQSYLSRFLSS